MKKRRPPQVKRKQGRKTLLTPEVQKRIVECLEQGNYQKTSYVLAGIPHSTFYDWLKWGEGASNKASTGESLTPEEMLYSDFSEAIKKAIESSVQKNLEIINSAARGGQESSVVEYLDKDGKVYKRVTSYTPPCWQAAAWILERGHPEQFALRGRIELNKNETVNRTVNINRTEVKVEVTAQNAGTVLDILTEVGAIPPPGGGIKH